MAAARDLWALVARPNAMIKIPATPAGIDAIRRATASGININVTLLFSLDAHAAVIDAYVAGLEELAGRGVVNTMPPATPAAFRDHGRVVDSLTGTERAARAVLADLGAAAVDLGAVTRRLLVEGVDAFADALSELLDGLGSAAIRT